MKIFNEPNLSEFDEDLEILKYDCPYCKYPNKAWKRIEIHIHLCENCNKIYLYSPHGPHKIPQSKPTAFRIKELRRQGFDTGCEEIAIGIYMAYKREYKKE